MVASINKKDSLYGFQVCLGTTVTSLLGAVGGYILGGPFPEFGASVGFVFAIPIGAVVSLVCDYQLWPSRVTLLCCATQFLGAVTCGLTYGTWTSWQDGPVTGALAGQLGGGVAGLIICAYWMRTRLRPGYCAVCSYCLKGLTIARCPECGTPFDSSELNKQDRLNS